MVAYVSIWNYYLILRPIMEPAYKGNNCKSFLSLGHVAYDFTIAGGGISHIFFDSS